MRIGGRADPGNSGLQVERSGRSRRDLAPEIAGAVASSYRSWLGLTI